jgi:hypothetical protein
MARAMAPGVNASAAAVLGSSLTVEMRSGMMTRHETFASIEKNPMATAATKPVFRKRFGETNGWGAVVIRRVKPAAASADPMKLPQEEAESNPTTSPWVIPNKNSPAASASRTPPGRSKLRSSDLSVCGNSRKAIGKTMSVNRSVP